MGDKRLHLWKRSMICLASYVLLVSVCISVCMFLTTHTTPFVWNWKSIFVLNFMFRIGLSVNGPK